MTGTEMISKERKEQIEKHGYSAMHDDEFNNNGQLLQASWFCLTLHEDDYPDGWDQWFRNKIIDKSKIERLAISGAFLAAEIDRLKRIEDEG